LSYARRSAGKNAKMKPLHLDTASSTKGRAKEKKIKKGTQMAEKLKFGVRKGSNPDVGMSGYS